MNTPESSQPTWYLIIRLRTVEAGAGDKYPLHCLTRLWPVITGGFGGNLCLSPSPAAETSEQWSTNSKNWNIKLKWPPSPQTNYVSHSCSFFCYYMLYSDVLCSMSFCCWINIREKKCDVQGVVPGIWFKQKTIQINVSSIRSRERIGISWSDLH